MYREVLLVPVFVMLVFQAVVNWKMTPERIEKIFPKRGFFVRLAYSSVIYISITSFSRRYLTAYLFSDTFLHLIILLLLSLFLLVECIQYMKNKTDINVMKNTIDQLVKYSIIMIVIIIVFLALYMRDNPLGGCVYCLETLVLY